MPCAKENATAVVANAPPTAISQPVRASARRRRRRGEHRDAGDDREAEEPAGLAAHALVEQAQPAGVAAEDAAAAATRPAAARVAARAAGLAGEPPEAVVAEDQRPDRVVGRAGDPRPVGGRRERDDHRPEAARDDHRGAAREQLAERARGGPRGATHSTPRRCPARPSAPRPSSPRSRGRRARRHSTSQRVRPSSSARTSAHSAPVQHRISSASGLLWREIATVIGVSASTRPATKPARRPKRAAHEVVDERHGRRSPSAPAARGSPASGSRRRAPTAPAPTARAAACPPSSRRMHRTSRTGTRSSSRSSSARRRCSTRWPSRCASSAHRFRTAASTSRAPSSGRGSGRERSLGSARAWRGAEAAAVVMTGKRRRGRSEPPPGSLGIR